MEIEMQQILTFEKLETENFWHFCVKNDNDDDKNDPNSIIKFFVKLIDK